MVGLLSGQRKDSNIFYQILEILGRPFVTVARRLSPPVILERHYPLVAFLLVLVIWLAATLGKIQTCVAIGVQQCR